MFHYVTVKGIEVKYRVIWSNVPHLNKRVLKLNTVYHATIHLFVVEFAKDKKMPIFFQFRDVHK